MPNTPDSLPITAIGLDFGLKKIGVAVGESITQSARPLAVIKSIENQPNYAAIEDIIQTWKPNIIVVGLPYTEDGQHQELTNLAQKFANILADKFKNKYNLEIKTIDERYSSLEAKRIFADLRKNNLAKKNKNKNNKQTLDDLAACVILERFFAGS